MSCHINNNKVEIRSKGKILNQIPIHEFTNDEIALISSSNFCPGCTKMPINGYNDKKKTSWCQFSRKIATLQAVYK